MHICCVNLHEKTGRVFRTVMSGERYRIDLRNVGIVSTVCFRSDDVNGSVDSLLQATSFANAPASGKSGHRLLMQKASLTQRILVLGMQARRWLSRQMMWPRNSE
jgi:hypothetical protein